MARASAGVTGKVGRFWKFDAQSNISSPMRTICSFSIFSKPSRVSLSMETVRKRSCTATIQTSTVSMVGNMNQKVQCLRAASQSYVCCDTYTIWYRLESWVCIAVDTYVDRPFELTRLVPALAARGPGVRTSSYGPDHRVSTSDEPLTLQLHKLSAAPDIDIGLKLQSGTAGLMKDTIASPPHGQKGQTKPLRNTGQEQKNTAFM